MKAGFVNIFGKPNAGKSTLLNTLLGQKLAIVSSKVQTTRHRIKGILTKPGEYQIIFSDTPGIIEPRYRLHEKMMQNVSNALEDADVAILITDVKEDPGESHQIFSSLKLSVPAIVVLNKTDGTHAEIVQQAAAFFKQQSYCKKVVAVSALRNYNTEELLKAILSFLPEGEAFFGDEELTDLPTRFFAGELVREKIYDLFGDEIPYHSAVVVNEFREKESIIKIQVDIIVQRETQKAILLGENGNMIKKLGTLARMDLEKFLDSKVFLQLFVKVRPKWRDNEMQLKEYGYY